MANKQMKIERFEAIDRTLFWKEKKILVIGDLHLGYEEALREQGWTVPEILLDETLEILKRVFQKTGKVREIILLGDVKHYFGGVSVQEFRDVFSVFDFLGKNLEENGKVIIVQGNHDNILVPAIKRFEFVELKESYFIGDLAFFHGNKRSFENLELFDNKHKVFVIGHFHPAIVLSEDVKKEKYKCFLYGKWKNKKMIVVPSFFSLVEGSDIRKEKLDGIDVKNFEVFAVSPDGNVFDFGKVKNIN